VIIWTAKLLAIWVEKIEVEEYTDDEDEQIDYCDGVRRESKNNSVIKKRNNMKMVFIFVVEWLTLLLCIREVPGSNLVPETGYPGRGFFFCGFPHSVQANAGIVP
jgi:hypothetical protein